MKITIKNFLFKKIKNNKFYILGIPLEYEKTDFGFDINYINIDIVSYSKEKTKEYFDIYLSIFEYFFKFNYEKLRNKFFIRLSIFGILFILEYNF